MANVQTPIAVELDSGNRQSKRGQVKDSRDHRVAVAAGSNRGPWDAKEAAVERLSARAPVAALVGHRIEAVARRTENGGAEVFRVLHNGVAVARAAVGAEAGTR